METSNNISLSGTGRNKRFQQALDPLLVRPFDQSTEDFLLYIQEYSNYVQYFNDNNEQDGNWNKFLAGNHEELIPYLENPKAFSKEQAEKFKLILLNELKDMAKYLENPDQLSIIQKERFSSPHRALLLSFLGLLKHAQTEFNKLPKRHLDYYYREVLQLHPKEASPDHVHVLFTLHEDVQQFLLPSGSQLNAGKDAEDKPLIYTTNHDLVINKAVIKQIKNLYRTQTGENEYRLFSTEAPKYLIAPPEPNAALTRWKIFGPSSNTPNNVPLGIVFASPLLMLSEGERTIIVKIDVEESDHSLLIELFNHPDTKVLVSTKTGMLELLPSNILINSEPMSIEIRIDQTMPAIETLISSASFIPPNPWPIVQFVWGAKIGAIGIRIKKISLDVNVNGLSKLIATNTDGPIDTSKPFEPFTKEAMIDSEFEFTHTELSNKRPNTIKLDLDWVGGLLDYKTYYQEYENVNLAKVQTTDTLAPSILNDISKVKVDIIEPGRTSPTTLYDGPIIKYKSTNEIEDGFKTPKNISPINDILVGMNASDKIKPEDIRNYRHFKITLKGRGFLFEQYPILQNKLSALVANVDKPKVTAKKDPSKPDETEYAVSGLTWSKKILPTPYIPKLKSISLNYTASTNTHNQLHDMQIFEIHPFGFKELEVVSNGIQKSYMLTNSYTNEAELYIGIEGIKAPQNLSILFQLSEGSAQPEAPSAQIEWSLLNHNKWQNTLDGTASGQAFVLSDDTNGLVQSGIIRFSFPTGLQPTSTLMPQGLYWLRAIVSPKANANAIQGTNSSLLSKDAVSDMLAIHTQGVLATLQNNNNAEKHFTQPLKPASIKELLEAHPEIDKVLQPYTSFGGRPYENDHLFYTRISERLRHKNRAFTMWDYERLILENFQGIHKVRCLYAEDHPGSVILVVIPNIKLQHPFAPFEPKAPLSILRDIELFLKEKSSPFVQIEVRNPHYACIQLNFDVKFNKGYDPGYYTNELQEALKRYLSPWAYDQGAEIEFDQTFYMGSIAYFIEKQSYVDFISGLQMFRLKDGKVESIAKDQKLENSNLNAIWVSAATHNIRVIESNIPGAGIGTMRVEYDFELR